MRRPTKLEICPWVAAFTPGVVQLGMHAGKFIGPIAKFCSGGGGGKPNFAQAGGMKPEICQMHSKKHSWTSS
ncbi:hypothetical protein ACFX13_035926 [Malus domestica]